jgi:hypothetical protein
MAETTLAEKINTALEFIKQPSTIKGLIAAAGAVGYAIDQTKLLDILGGVAALVAIVNLFYDANPRKSIDSEVPAAVVVDKLNKTLTTAQIAELVKLRKADIAAEKACPPGKG